MHVMISHKGTIRNSKELHWGLPAEWVPEYTRLLKQKYGVESGGEGCIVSQSFLAYAEEYNSTARSAAIQRFGRDIFKETMDEAQRIWSLRAGSRGQGAK